MERRLGGWVKKGTRLRSTNWQLQNSHGDAKYSVEKIINNIVVTMYGARLDHFEMTGIAGSSCKV